MERMILLYVCWLVVLALLVSGAHPEVTRHAEDQLLQGTTMQPAAAAAEAHSGFVVDTRNIVALVIAFVVASLAATAGVGGGAFFTPMAMVFLNFSLKEATVLSQASIAAVSAASILLNLPKRHPTAPATKTLIDYQLCLSMTPALLLGVSVGVVFNAALPTWLITTLLITVLTFMSVRTVQKGLQLWHTETCNQQQQQQQQQQQHAAVPNTATAAAAAVGSGSGSQGPASAVEAPAAANAAAAVVVISDGPTAGGGDLDKPRHARYPYGMLLGVVFLWFGFSGLQLLRQQMQRCSPAYFAVCAAQVLFGGGCSLLFAYVCIARPARQQAAAAAADADGLQAPLLAGNSTGHPPRPASLSSLLTRREQQQHESMTVLSLTAVKVAVAGVAAGILGIGGGMLMGPMLLDAGVHPQSASATSNILVFMCSSSATLAFLLDGRVDVQYSAVYGVVCGAASVLGLTLFGRLVKMTGRPSLVVLLLAFIMGAGAVCSGVFGYLDAWQQAKQGTGGWKAIC